MFIVKRQDGFGGKAIELYHTDHKVLAEKYRDEYNEQTDNHVLIFIEEVPGNNTKANAEKENKEVKA